MIKYYAVTGGVPKYIEQFQNNESDIFSAIKEKILNKSSFLYEEPHFLLQNEVSEAGSYFSVIKTIAAGNQKLAKIASSLEVKQTGLSKYLKTLSDLDILKRQVPVTEEHPDKSKRGLYKIKAVKWKQNERKNWYVLFSISGFTEQLQLLVKERDDIILSS